jgi:LPS-assembly lipoprotein
MSKGDATLFRASKGVCPLFMRRGERAWSLQGLFGRASRATDGECEPPGTGLRRLSGTGPGGTRTTHAILLLLVATLLAGCGFRLQGALDLPEQNRRIYLVAADELTPFAVELRRAVERAGGRVAASPSEADLVVRILRDRGGRRILSVSARNTPQEYEVYYSVSYAVDRDRREVLELQPLELVRNLSFEESQLLAKEREEAILRDAMARDLALLVLRRLETL